MRGGELGETGSGAGWKAVRLGEKRKLFVEEVMNFARRSMRCLKNGEEENGEKGWEEEEADRAVGCSESGEQERAVRKVRSRGLRLRGSSTTRFEILA